MPVIVAEVEAIVLMTTVPLVVMVVSCLELGCAVIVTGCVLLLHVFVGCEVLSAVLDGENLDALISPSDEILLLIVAKPWSLTK